MASAIRAPSSSKITGITTVVACSMSSTVTTRA
jgi:hypothetical protein